ncbi:hypothetical protein Q5752_003685 [Cryptotrichosporon argae]
MADSTRYGNPADYDVDLHSIYASYLGDFDAQGIDWWDSTWGGFFSSFNDFLGFGWEAMVVVDSVTGRAHVAARRDQIAQFARMIKTRFGENLDKDPPTLLTLRPVQSRARSLHRLVPLSDLAAYRKLCSSLAPAELAYVRARARAGEPRVVQALFFAGAAGESGTLGVRDNGRGYTWAAIKTTWWEKGGAPQGMVPGLGRTAMARPGQGGKALILEVGVAALRCANLRAVDVWPPVPEQNYRKAHYITEEWVDKRTNVDRPSYPRAYGFGKSQFVAERTIERIVESSLSGLAGQEGDGAANTLILLSAGEPQPLPLPNNTTLPNNVIHVDVLALEHSMYQQARREGLAGDRIQPLSSLRQLLQQLQIPVPHHIPLGNAGNDAFYMLLAFQKLLIKDTRLPDRLFPQAVPAPAEYGYGQPAFGYQNPYPSFASFPSQVFQPTYSPSQGHDFTPPPPIRTDGRRMSHSSSKVTMDRRHASESSTRPRPLSMSSSDLSPTSGPITSNPASLKQKPPLPRSQTVYWDEAEYASSPSPDGSPRTPRTDKGGHDKEGSGSRSSRPPLRASDPPDSRSRSVGGLPPSSLRNSQLLASATSSRSVSFNEDHRPPPSSFQPPAGYASSAYVQPSQVTLTREPGHGRRRSDVPTGGSGSKDSNDSKDSTGSSKAGGGRTPGRSSDEKGSSSGLASASSGSVPRTASSGSVDMNGCESAVATVKDDKKNRRKSTRDIKGALARFWVG